MMSEITDKQIDDLKHACSEGRFMTEYDDPDMRVLINNQLMAGPFFASFLGPDFAYFKPTDDGRSFVEDFNSLASSVCDTHKTGEKKQ